MFLMPVNKLSGQICWAIMKYWNTKALFTILQNKIKSNISILRDKRYHLQRFSRIHNDLKKLSLSVLNLGKYMITKSNVSEQLVLKMITTNKKRPHVQRYYQFWVWRYFYCCWQEHYLDWVWWQVMLVVRIICQGMRIDW